MNTRLTEQLNSELPDWKISDGKLFKEFNFKSFMEGINFINKVALQAENVDHHPDIFISFRTIKIQLFTHDEHKITDKDYKLAKEINNLKI